MENNFTTRTSFLVGDDGIKKLNNSNIIVFGVGGIRSFTVEASKSWSRQYYFLDFDDVI